MSKHCVFVKRINVILVMSLILIKIVDENIRNGINSKFLFIISMNDKLNTNICTVLPHKRLE